MPQFLTMLQMYSSRRAGAVLLVSVLVGGSLLAPLSHLIYMAADGMFAAGHHHPIQMEMDGECVHEAHETHPECPYLTLFAVPLTGDVAELIALPSRDHSAEPLLKLLILQQTSAFLEFRSARDPPLNA